MSKTSKAFVLRGYNSKEKDKNILLFSLEEGKIWVTLKGVRGDKAKMKYAKEPFCFGEFTIEEGKFSNVVTSVEIIEPFNELAQNVDKYFEGQAILEIVNTLNFENERYPLFVSLLKALKTLAFHNAVKNSCLIKFLIDVFDIYGLKVYSEKCTCCGAQFHDHVYINYNVGELVCGACKTFQSEELSKAEYMVLKNLTNNDYEKLPTIKFPEEVGEKLLKKLVKNFSFRFEKDLKMMGILS